MIGRAFLRLMGIRIVFTDNEVQIHLPQHLANDRFVNRLIERLEKP
jgi:hypothetical protein